MSPTLLRSGGFRFYFFSREERRQHVHVLREDRGAKFWLEPSVELAQNRGLSPNELRNAESLVRDHAEEFRHAWRRHFDL